VWNDYICGNLIGFIMLDYICIVFCIAFMSWNIYAIISEAKRDRRMEQEFRKRMDALR